MSCWLMSVAARQNFELIGAQHMLSSGPRLQARCMVLRRLFLNQRQAASKGTVAGTDPMELAVCGLHMRGQKLEHQLTDLNGSFAKACKSAPTYKLYAITDRTNGICKPGMVYVGHGQGRAIELEVWNLPADNLGKFFQQISAPLGLGTLLLEDGTNVKGFICEGFVSSLADKAASSDSRVNSSNLLVKDITEYGSWRQFQAQ